MTSTGGRRRAVAAALAIKKYRLVVKYYVRQCLLRASAWWPVALYCVAVALFLAVLFPTLVRRLPIYGEWPLVLDLHGTVVADATGVPSMPAAGAVVEIGGARAIADANGVFQIRFFSKAYRGIPVIIQWRGQTAIRRISFGAQQVDMAQEFTIDAP